VHGWGPLEASPFLLSGAPRPGQRGTVQSIGGGCAGFCHRPLLVALWRSGRNDRHTKFDMPLAAPRMLIIAYLILCFVVGIAGRQRRLGFFGFFLLSVLLTPVMPLGWLLLTQRRFLARPDHIVIRSNCAAVEARAAAARLSRSAQ
jgi:hypothetical protein